MRVNEPVDLSINLQMNSQLRDHQIIAYCVGRSASLLKVNNISVTKSDQVYQTASSAHTD